MINCLITIPHMTGKYNPLYYIQQITSAHLKLLKLQLYRISSIDTPSPPDDLNMFEGQSPQKKASSKANNGHLGSRSSF